MKQTPRFAPTHFYFPIFYLLFLLSQNLQAQFVTNGSAGSSGAGCYALTQNAGNQAGSILSTSTVNLAQSFMETATLNFGTNDANGADGIVFIFATSNGVVGGTGENIGYGGIVPSLTIEMDTWQNGNQGDPAADHMAITSGGSVSHIGPTNLAGPISLPNIEDGNDHCFAVSWDPASQTLSGSLDGNTVIYVGDITGILGRSVVYWGCTAST
ncbi:MAG: L-type lectin-domain containing protein, partial [Bacteroidota bacterium]